MGGCVGRVRRESTVKKELSDPNNVSNLQKNDTDITKKKEQKEHLHLRERKKCLSKIKELLLDFTYVKTSWEASRTDTARVLHFHTASLSNREVNKLLFCRC